MAHPVLLCLCTLTAADPATPGARLLAGHDGKTPPPPELLTAYEGFVRVARSGDPAGLRPLTLPSGVRDVIGDPPPEVRAVVNAVNMNFLKDPAGFSENLVSSKPLPDGAFLLKTASTELRYVRTKGGKWLLYRYADIPLPKK